MTDAEWLKTMDKIHDEIERIRQAAKTIAGAPTSVNPKWLLERMDILRADFDAVYRESYVYVVEDDAND